MADTITTLIPQITAATITPNPVGTGASFKLSVAVTDKQVELDPVWYFSGEIYSGETEA